MNLEPTYRVLTEDEFTTFLEKGLFYGAQKDVSAGFIHLSNLRQLRSRIEKFEKLGIIPKILEIDTTRLRHAIRWETSRDGEVYPHLYTYISSEFAKPVSAASLQLA